MTQAWPPNQATHSNDESLLTHLDKKTPKLTNPVIVGAMTHDCDKHFEVQLILSVVLVTDGQASEANLVVERDRRSAHGTQRVLALLQPQAEPVVLVCFIASKERCSCTVALDRRRVPSKFTQVMNL